MYLEVSGLSLYENTTKNNNNKKRTGSRNKENMYFHNVENLQTFSNAI